MIFEHELSSTTYPILHYHLLLTSRLRKKMPANNLSNLSLFLIALIVLFVAAHIYLKQRRVLPPGPPGIHVEASP